MEKRTPIQKSIVRHKLKEIDKKWAGRKIKGPAHEKVLSKSLWKKYPEGATVENRMKLQNETRGNFRRSMQEHIKRFSK